MEKQKKCKKEKKSNWLVKIYRFFVPKDFKTEFQKGKEMGSTGLAKGLGGAMFDFGKAARKKVDPEHKMKIGKKKDNEENKSNDF